MASVLLGGLRAVFPSGAPSWKVAAAVWALIVLTSLPAAAEKERVRLEYQVDPGCPTEQVFVSEILARTEKVAFLTEGAGRVMRVTAHLAPTGAWGELRLHEPGQAATPRRISGETCSQVVAALALVAVLAVDPQANLALTDAARRAPEPSRTVSPAPVDTPRPSSSAPLVRAPPRRARPRWWSLTVMGGLEGRTPDAPAPLVALTAAVEAGLAWGWRPAVRLGIGAGATPRLARTPWEEQFLNAWGRCEFSPFRFGSGPFRLSPWVGLEGGQLTGLGFRESTGDRLNRQSTLWLAVVEVARLQGALGRGFFVELEVGAIQPLKRDKFFFRWPDYTAHTVPDLGGVAGLGIAHRFF